MNVTWLNCHLRGKFCHCRSDAMKATKRSVGFLVVSPFEQLNLVGPSAVFSEPQIAGNPAYQVHLLSASKEVTVRSHGGLTIGPATHYTKFEEPLDTLLVIGGEGAMGRPEAALINWLSERSKRTRRVGSVCTGAFVLAATGLLDRRRAVTHWRHCAELAARYPRVRVERDPIFIKDGKIYTTAGVTAGIDLALALVEEDLGYATAMEVARELVLFLRRPGGQAQFSQVLTEQENISDAALRSLPSWVAANLKNDLSVRALAIATSMSDRTFARRFRETFHMTPATWVQSLRVETVRQHLETDNLGLKEIASRTGFRDIGSLRRAFRTHLKTSPAEYRARFRRMGRN
jgi:transcriptional regulator GlxA family with amidase domain